MRTTATFFFAIAICACTAATESTGPPQNIPASTATNAGPTGGIVQANTTEFCSVEIVWNYTDQTTTFKNKNDQTAKVSVTRIVDGSLVVSNYLAADGTDSESASFAIGDSVEVVVEFLDLNLSLDQWKECGRKTYILGR